MRLASSIGVLAAVCLLGAAACGGDDGGGSGGSSGSGGSGGTSGSGGSSTGGAAGSSSGGAAGSSSGGAAGSSTGGAAGSGTGGSGGSAGSGAGGSGGLSAGPGQFNYKGQVNGQSIAGNCTPKNNSDVDSYSTVIAGKQLNISCPGVIGTAISNDAAGLVLKSYATLPATFSFNAADGLGTYRKYELAAWATGSSNPQLTQSNGNVQSIEVNGTYDSATKHVTGTVKGTWGTPTKPLYEAEGWLEIAFDVTHP